MYNRTIWVDETDEFENRYTETVNSDGTITHTKVTGEVYVEGTPQSAVNFNNIEDAVVDAHVASSLLLMLARQNSWEIEKGSVELTNTSAYPFNNSKTTVALSNGKENGDYVVLTEVSAFSGNVGEIVVSDKLRNGFKVEYTGSASSVTVDYIVIGGILK